VTANTLASADQPFTDVAAVVCDPPSARVYEHGWQSGSPTTTYGLRDRPYRPVGETTRVMCYLKGAQTRTWAVTCWFVSDRQLVR
jgi:hypothetical protein